jgi:O-acetyl-ADP-ribose deacetylase (regulator of RNase III)
MMKIGTTEVHFHSGDIATVPAEVMITAINSSGLWHGGIDGVIQWAAGNMFHDEAAGRMPLQHGETVLARRTGMHRGAWGDVMFVVDDLQGPLRNIVQRSLYAVSQAGYRTVSLPAIRTGVMLGVVEKTAKLAVQELLTGVRDFLVQNPTAIQEIHFVVFRDETVYRLLASS